MLLNRNGHNSKGGKMSESHVAFINFDDVPKRSWHGVDGIDVPIETMSKSYLKSTLSYINRCFQRNRHLYESSTYGITHAKQKILIDGDYMHALESVKFKRDELLIELKSRK